MSRARRGLGGEGLYPQFNAGGALFVPTLGGVNAEFFIPLREGGD